MPDEMDMSSATSDLLDEVAIANVREVASKIPDGAPGDCDMCGEWSGRLVNGVCAPCRDRYGFP